MLVRQLDWDGVALQPAMFLSWEFLSRFSKWRLDCVRWYYVYLLIEFSQNPISAELPIWGQGKMKLSEPNINTISYLLRTNPNMESLLALEVS